MKERRERERVALIVLLLLPVLYLIILPLLSLERRKREALLCAATVASNIGVYCNTIPNGCSSGVNKSTNCSSEHPTWIDRNHTLFLLIDQNQTIHRPTRSVRGIRVGTENPLYNVTTLSFSCCCCCCSAHYSYPRGGNIISSP